MIEEMLDIVDDNDNVIGTASRSDVHAKGLLHREVSILFVTPSGDLIFQRRSKTKATNPGMLAFTVAGHVTAGDSYETAVLKEAVEETGLSLTLEDLVLIKKDKTPEGLNYCNRMLYGYVFNGPLEDLQAEEGEGDGFVTIVGKDIFDLPDHLRQSIATNLLDPERYGTLYKKVLALVEQK